MQHYEELSNLHKYMRKAINTKLTQVLLKQKAKQNDALKSSIEHYLEKEYANIDDALFHSVVKNTRLWNSEIRRIIDHKLEILNLHRAVHQGHNKSACSLSGIAKTTTTYEHTAGKQKQSSPKAKLSRKMAPPVFDMKQATAIVPVYDGAPDDLDAFIDAINLLAELTAAENMATAVKFVKIRLTKKARLGLPNNLATLQEIADDLKRRCQRQESPDTVIAKLNQVRIKSSAMEFCEEVENLTLKLKSIYMEQQVPENVANTMATKVGLESLINGIPSNDTKLILKAGTFTDIKQAILKVNQYTDRNAQVLIANTSRQNSNREYNNYNANRNNAYRGGYRSPQTNNYQRGRNNNFRGNGGQRYHNNNNTPMNFQNSNNQHYARQHFNGNRQQRGSYANRQYQQPRRVYTGAATPLLAEPQACLSTGMQQNLMSQAYLTNSPSAMGNQPALAQYPLNNIFLGQIPCPPQHMQ